MAAIAPLEDLKSAASDLSKVQKKHTEAVKDLLEVFNRHKMVGYKNMVKILNGSTPEKLKGLE